MKPTLSGSTEQLLELLSTSVADQAICLVDEKKIIRSWNAGAENFYQYTSAEIVGKPVNSLLSSAGVKTLHTQVSSIKKINKLETEVCRKDGSCLPVYITFEPIYQDKLLRGYGFIARSLAYSKKLSYCFDGDHITTENNTILESIGDAFFSIDRDWIVQYWNHVAERVLQTPKELVVGKQLWMVFESSIGSLSYQKYHEALESGKDKNFEDYYDVLDRWYDISAYPSESGLSVYFKDITQRKRTEQELKTQAEALEMQNQKLKEISWMQSHVIRAPLARIMGLIELINTTDPNKNDMLEILQFLESSAQELDEVVRAITASANESGRSKGSITGL